MKLMLSFVTVIAALSVTGVYAHSYTKHAQQSCIQKIVTHCETPHGGLKASSACFSLHFDENNMNGMHIHNALRMGCKNIVVSGSPSSNLVDIQIHVHSYTHEHPYI